MTDIPDWRIRFRVRHHELIARLEMDRPQYQTGVGEFPRLLAENKNMPSSCVPDSSTPKRELSDFNDRRRELEKEQVRQEFIELYSRCLERACESEATYEEQIRVLLSVFQYDIPSRVVADVVGCSRGHARRFEWDEGQKEVREKAWSRKQRAHQVPPALAEQVRIRDDHECVRCGSDDELRVHHIDPAGQQGPAVMENLGTLCNQCHKVAHGGNVSSGEVIHDSVEEFWNWATEDGE